ncbi:hypothetical protein L7F22_021959 [Adiantum nelumboides]|nr:hypothetical protein [Adiantum nelumboides]
MGCNYATVRNSEVLWRCKKRKRLMSDTVKFRQEFAAAQLAYIQTLKQVGHSLFNYANRQPSNTEVVHTEKKAEATGDASPPSVEPSPEPLSRPSPEPLSRPSPEPLSAPSSSPLTTEQSIPAAPSSMPSPQQIPILDATHVQPSKNDPVIVNKEAAMPNGLHSPTIQSFLRLDSDDGLVSSMPSSPMNGSAYYSFSQPSSPQSSDWDPFNLFSAFPFRSPERVLLRLRNWDPDMETTTSAVADGLPDLEDVETGQKVEVDEPKKTNVENVVGKVNINESLGKAEKKHIEPHTEKMLPKIEEDSAEEAVSPTENTKLTLVTKAMDKESYKLQGVKDVSLFLFQINECMKRISVAFENALQSGNEVSQILEAQIVYPRRRLRDLSDSFRLASTTSWQWPRRSSSTRVDIDESDDEMGQGILESHSLTLERLYTWERKLYKEVKTGEQLHIAFLRKSREFHSVDVKSKDPDLIEQCRADMKSLESQLAVAFRAISSISFRIQQVTYEELYPQLIELLRRLRIMWKAMFECHTTQKEAALEILTLESSGHYKISPSDGHRSATTELEKQLEAWRQGFYLWVISQQRYIDTLLTWIKVCHMEPESNSRKGSASPAWTKNAPIYMLARNWHDSLLCLEENTEVVNAIDKFSIRVHEVQVSEWEELVQMKRADLASRSMDLRSRSRRANERSGEQEKGGEGEDAVLASLRVHLPSIFDSLATFSSVACKEYEKLHKEAVSLIAE